MFSHSYPCMPCNSLQAYITRPHGTDDAYIAPAIVSVHWVHLFAMQKWLNHERVCAGGRLVCGPKELRIGWSTHWQIPLHCAQQTQQQQQPFNGRLSRTTWVGRYQKKHSPAHTHPGQRTSFITFLHLQRSTASSLFSLRA